MRDLSLAIERGWSVAKPLRNPNSVYRLNLAILVSIFILGLTYLFTVNSLGTKGYAIRNLEQEIKQLEDSQMILQLKASDLQSINHIQTGVQKLNFVPVSNVTYLKAADYALK